VRARQDLVKAYRSAGDRGSAERVKLARKPTRAAWTVNQLARQEKAGVRSLLNAGKRLRAAQQKALGGGSGSALRKATDEERETLRPLVDAARRILSANDEKATEATLLQVERTLHAAARDEELAEIVRRSRLTRELDPTGFGPFTAGEIKKRTRSKRTNPKRARTDERARQQELALRQRIRDLRRASPQRSVSSRRRNGPARQQSEVSVRASASYRVLRRS
jgi:hypothetical protein